MRGRGKKKTTFESERKGNYAEVCDQGTEGLWRSPGGETVKSEKKTAPGRGRLDRPSKIGRKGERKEPEKKTRRRKREGWREDPLPRLS